MKVAHLNFPDSQRLIDGLLAVIDGDADIAIFRDRLFRSLDTLSNLTIDQLAAILLLISRGKTTDCAIEKPATDPNEINLVEQAFASVQPEYEWAERFTEHFRHLNIFALTVLGRSALLDHDSFMYLSKSGGLYAQLNSFLCHFFHGYDISVDNKISSILEEALNASDVFIKNPELRHLANLWETSDAPIPDVTNIHDLSVSDLAAVAINLKHKRKLTFGEKDLLLGRVSKDINHSIATGRHRYVRTVTDWFRAGCNSKMLTLTEIHIPRFDSLEELMRPFGDRLSEKNLLDSFVKLELSGLGPGGYLAYSKLVNSFNRDTKQPAAIFDLAQRALGACPELIESKIDFAPGRGYGTPEDLELLCDWCDQHNFQDAIDVICACWILVKLLIFKHPLSATPKLRARIASLSIANGHVTTILALAQERSRSDSEIKAVLEQASHAGLIKIQSMQSNVINPLNSQERLSDNLACMLGNEVFKSLEQHSRDDLIRAEKHFEHLQNQNYGSAKHELADYSDLMINLGRALEAELKELMSPLFHALQHSLQEDPKLRDLLNKQLVNSARTPNNSTLGFMLLVVEQRKDKDKFGQFERLLSAISESDIANKVLPLYGPLLRRFSENRNIAAHGGQRTFKYADAILARTLFYGDGAFKELVLAKKRDIPLFTQLLR